MTVDCDIHPNCQSQGCAADPMHCNRAEDIRTRRAANAALARPVEAGIAFDKLDYAGKVAKIEYHLGLPAGYPIPAWVLRWLLDHYESRR